MSAEATVITNMPMYRAIVLRAAIKLYVETGIKANRGYTVKNMLRSAGEITGKQYQRTQLKLALLDLSTWLEVKKLSGETLQDEKPL